MQFLSVSFSLLIQSLLFDQKRTPSNVSAQYLKCVCVMSRDSLLNYSCPTCNLKGRDLDILFCCPAADVFDSPFNFEILFCIFRDSLLTWFIFYFSTYRLFLGVFCFYCQMFTFLKNQESGIYWFPLCFPILFIVVLPSILSIHMTSIIMLIVFPQSSFASTDHSLNL